VIGAGGGVALVLGMIAHPPVVAADPLWPAPAGRELVIGTDTGVSAAGSQFNASGAREQIPAANGGSFWGASLGLYLAYGFTDRLAVTLNFAPGYSFFSRFKDDYIRRMYGVSDIDLKLPWQLFDSGSVRGPSGAYSVTLSPLFHLALPGPNYAHQLERKQQGLAYAPSNTDFHAWGAGAALDASVDGAVNDNVHISIGTKHQVLFFLPSSYEDSSLGAYNLNQLRESLPGVDPYDTIWYVYEYRGEIYAGFKTIPVADASLHVLVPISFRRVPEPRVDKNLVVPGTDVSELTAGLSIRLTAPDNLWTFGASYRAVVCGHGVTQAHTVNLSVTRRFDLTPERLPAAAPAAGARTP